MASTSDRLSTASSSSSSSKPGKLSPLDFRNTELVSRLLAANPPYLYTALPPTTFFFSELLRSFVQHHKETTAAAQARLIPTTATATSSPSTIATSTNRRARKRTWTATKAESTRTSPELLMPPPPPPAPTQPPPMWYPPLYPAYALDPLNFFVDNNKSESLAFRHRHHRRESAFSVPVRPQAKRFDVESLGIDRRTNRLGAAHVMKSLGAIYGAIGTTRRDIATPNASEEQQEEAAKDDDEEKQKRDLKDLQELIGLELVVDYMNHSKSGSLMLASDVSSLTDLESRSESPTLEVVAVNDL